MDNAKTYSVIRQLFSLLPIDFSERLLFDHYAKKLTVLKGMMVFIAAQLNGWASFEQMSLQIRAEPKLRRLFQLDSGISASQLSRKLDQIPTEILQWVFLQLAARLRPLHTEGFTKNIGKLGIIDSTTMHLPLGLGDWAKLSRKGSGVKMHLRLAVVSSDLCIPDAMVPSSRNVGDREGAVELVTDPDTTYVMDRGYDDYRRMDKWVENKIQFVMRVRDRTATTVIETLDVPPNSPILRDAIVRVGATTQMKQLVRLVEFQDELGRRYRLLTSRMDLTAAEIAQIYKCRWLIELYFKWLKQHLCLKKLHSYKPQAIWNQLFLVLITALLVESVKRKLKTKRTTWQLLQAIRVYMLKPFVDLLTELERPPSRKSKGRRPGAVKKRPFVRTTVGKINPSKARKKGESQ